MKIFSINTHLTSDDDLMVIQAALCMKFMSTVIYGMMGSYIKRMSVMNMDYIRLKNDFEMNEESVLYFTDIEAVKDSTGIIQVKMAIDESALKILNIGMIKEYITNMRQFLKDKFCKHKKDNVSVFIRAMTAEEDFKFSKGIESDSKTHNESSGYAVINEAFMNGQEAIIREDIFSKERNPINFVGPAIHLGRKPDKLKPITIEMIDATLAALDKGFSMPYDPIKAESIDLLLNEIVDQTYVLIKEQNHIKTRGKYLLERVSFRYIGNEIIRKLMMFADDDFYSKKMKETILPMMSMLRTYGFDYGDAVLSSMISFKAGEVLGVSICI